MTKNTELELAYKFIQYTNKNVFLTGKAGTGKTTFLKSLKQKTFKRMVVLAPTGVAAINAGGVTIHSFFQLAFGPILTEKVAGYKIENRGFKQKFNKTKINIIKSLDLLVIDEISMVRADVLDAVDEALRKYKNRSLPFGGVQLLMIGDLQQLAPIVKEEDQRILSPYYESLFFFNSKALKESQMITLELKKVYRQEDDSFLQILNEIRNDKLSPDTYDLLHKRYIPDFSPKDNEGYITLTTHNISANAINKDKLEKINNPSYMFEAEIEGNFSEYAYPTDYQLELKVGAQVMFNKNDSNAEKRYYNGKIGTVTGFEEDFIIITCEGDSEEIYTAKERWENIRYTISEKTKEISEELIGAFIQYPLRLAWAITIHKSQGLTFEKAVIDTASAFAHGQTYVALSRCKTLEGLVLSSKISKQAVISDKEVNDFNKYIEDQQPNENNLKEAMYAYQAELIDDLFNYKQLSYRFGRFEKKLRELDGTYIGNIGETIYQIQNNALPEISKISQGFLREVNQLLSNEPDVEKNMLLQERLKKAAGYFIKFHQEKIITELESGSFESDNNSVRKDLKESKANVNEILNIKQKCFEVILKGFKMKDYLEARAKAALEEKDSSKKTKITFKETESEHPELYQKLKEWRKAEAETENIPLYMILANKSLHEISNKLPVTSKQLQSIKGIGKKKSEQHGDAIISLVSEYNKTKGIEAKKDLPEVKNPIKKKNWEISYEMYKEGKSIKEIAKEQDFTTATIENHLGRYIVNGELKIEEFVNPEVVSKVYGFFEKKPKSSLSEVKAALPDEITYSQIKLVQKHIQFLKEKTTT